VPYCSMTATSSKLSPEKNLNSPRNRLGIIIRMLTAASRDSSGS
jgi:hypothetical protein